jgi:hypothetical protein
MTTPLERRRLPRADLPLAIIVRGVDATGTSFQLSTTVENLSASGLYIYLPQPLQPGIRLFVCVRLALVRPDAGAPHVAAHGHVVRVTSTAEKRTGVAVVFDHARLLHPIISPPTQGRTKPMSVLTIDPPLPCAEAVLEGRGPTPSRQCGQLAMIGVISPQEGGVWELLPICRKHAQEFHIFGGRAEHN